MGFFRLSPFSLDSFVLGFEGSHNSVVSPTLNCYYSAKVLLFVVIAERLCYCFITVVGMFRFIFFLLSGGTRGNNCTATISTEKFSFRIDAKRRNENVTAV